MRTVVFDFETASRANLKVQGAWRYAEDPSTWVLCAAVQVIENGQLAGKYALTEAELRRHDFRLMELALDPTVIFVAHNGQFEQSIWWYVMHLRWGWPALPPERWHDTMAVAARKALPLALEKLAYALNLPVKKDMEGHRVMMKLCKPGRDGAFHHAASDLQRLYDYGMIDVDTQTAAHFRLGGLKEERPVWILDQKMNQRGIRIDVPYVKQAIGLLENVRGPLAKEFAGITGGLKPTQRDKVKAWMADNGLTLPDMRKDTMDRLLNPSDDLAENEGWYFDQVPDHVFRAGQIRRVLASNSVKKLERMMETVNSDGRVRGTSQYHGARTGRNAGRLVQPLNMPRPLVTSIPQKELMKLVQEGRLDVFEEMGTNAFDAVISTLRGCFRPADGRCFSTGDYNAIEARVVLALAGEYERANAFDTGDAYSDMAEKIYGVPVDKISQPALRQTGKMVTLGCGFQMSARRFQLQAVPDKPLEFAEKCVKAYREDFAPLVPKLWYGLQKAATRAVWCKAKRAYDFRGIVYQVKGDFLTCRLPSGRELFYYLPFQERVPVPWDENDVRDSWSYMDFAGGKITRKLAFGGLLTENVVQATARDIMIEATFRCEDAGLPLVFTVYDELVTEPDGRRNDVVEALQQCMEERSPWVQEWNIPIKAECERLEEYQK